MPQRIPGAGLDFARQDDVFQAPFFPGNLTIVRLKRVGVIGSKSVFKKLNKSAALPRRGMASVYGLEASQKCITPSACAVVAELVTLAVSSGSFSLLVAFELPVSSKHTDNYLFFVPCG